jgi:hypothetical protein
MGRRPASEAAATAWGSGGTAQLKESPSKVGLRLEDLVEELEPCRVGGAARRHLYSRVEAFSVYA